MDLNNLNIFNKLKLIWQAELNSEKLNRLNNEDFEVLIKFQKHIHTLENKTQADNKRSKEISTSFDSIIQEIRTSSVSLVDFYINDLLDLRQEKIIKSCKALKIIDEEFLTKIEYDFYNYIISAFKGYKKMRNMYSLIADACFPEPIKKQNEAFCQNPEFLKKGDDTEYSLIRVLREIPSIVGFDMIAYGPFNKEDIAKIPKINAIILEKENSVEFIGNMKENNVFLNKNA